MCMEVETKTGKTLSQERGGWNRSTQRRRCGGGCGGGEAEGSLEVPATLGAGAGAGPAAGGPALGRVPSSTGRRD